VESIYHVRLRPGKEIRLLSGHPWVYRNDLHALPTSVVPGDLADLRDSRGGWLGRAYLNPRSTIVARLLTRESISIDESFFTMQLDRAQSWRERMLGVKRDACLHPYRLVHSDADGLPGLIVDRYGDALVMQLLTAGMERRRDMIVSALEKIFQPRLIVARNDSAIREREGLPRERTMVKGQLPAEALVHINNATVAVDLWEGQKTGLFLDQLQNYEAIAPLSPGAKVLDCFCYLGLWGLHAARYGAAEVIGVDQSPGALERAAVIADQNGYAERCRFHAANVFDDLRDRVQQRELFDLVMLDPPAFVKNRARVPEAVKGYKEINLRAMKLLRPGGYLVTCSCSHHISVQQFEALLLDAATDVRRSVRLIARRGQGPDHPVLLGMPETEYLKCFLLQVV
jgi:23S rRNA (cytosine1962-C5)-methyltransferase